MKPLILLSLLVLLVGCRPDEPEEQAVPPPATTAEVEEGWQVHEAGPEADEEHPGSVLLTRRAEAVEAAGYRPRLVLGCEEGVTQAYIEWGTPLGAAEVPVTYRLDDGALQAARWQVSADREAAGMWDDGLSVPFIRALLGRRRLEVAATPTSGRPAGGHFDLSDLDSLIVPAQALCGWE